MAQPLDGNQRKGFVRLEREDQNEDHAFDHEAQIVSADISSNASTPASIDVEDSDSAAELSWVSTPTSIDVEDSAELSWVTEFKDLFHLALPMIGTYMATMGMSVVVLFFVGRLGAESLAAAALASMFCNVTGFSVINGLNSASDTLSSQAFGARNYHSLGVLLQRSLLISSLFAVGISLLWIVAEQVLLLFGQSSTVSSLAGQYCRIMIAGLPAYCFYEAVKRYLQAQSIVFPTTVISAITVGFCASASYILIFSLDWGFLGAPLALVLSYWFSAACLYVWVTVGGLHLRTWTGWSRECLQDWRPYLRLGVPGVAMLCAEWWGFEVHALIAGRFGTVSLAAQTLLLNSISLMFMYSLGISISASIRVGNFLGAGKPRHAALCSRVSLASCMVGMSFQAIAFLAARSYWGYIFTNDEEVVSLVARTIPILASFMVFDGLQGVASGVLRGCGRQKLGAYTNIIGYWLLALPLSFPLAFNAGLGIRGQYLALSVASICICVVFLTAIYRMDWNKHACEATEREAASKAAHQDAGGFLQDSTADSEDPISQIFVIDDDDDDGTARSDEDEEQVEFSSIEMEGI